MIARELVALPDAYRKTEIYEADDLLLVEALEIAKNQGSAHAAADIAYELGRRMGETDDE